MSTLYDNELLNVKRDFLNAGHTEREWREDMDCAAMTLKAFGFRDAYEVRRLANTYGKRVA